MENKQETYGEIEVDLSTFPRDLLEYLVRTSCEQDISINKVIENVLITYLASNEISNL